MEKIINILNNKINTPSDINEHLLTIKKYSEDCDHITEMGVRDCVSTWAMLASNPKKMISYDIVRHNNVSEVEKLTNDYSIDFTFKTSDSLQCEIDETDLLLIDTLHTYNQLISELKLHNDKVKKYIILHDVVSFGYSDEKIYNHASDIIKNTNTSKVGLMNAVNDFLTQNNHWRIKETFKNNNGLMILERVKN